MECVLLCIGKNDSSALQQLMGHYEGRLQHYTKFSIQCLNDPKNRKNLREQQQKEAEALLIERALKPTDRVVLLDEKGTSYTSEGFATYLNKQQLAGHKRLVFVVGGPYGFAPALYARAHQKIQLSSMTFSHQMVRLFFVEQLYRAHTILKNEPYHHR